MNCVFATSAESFKLCKDKIIPLSLVNVQKFVFPYCDILGTAVAQWLRCCATNRKVAGSIPADVFGIFH